MEEEKREVPNAEIWAAMAEVEEMKKHPGTVREVPFF